MKNSRLALIAVAALGFGVLGVTACVKHYDKTGEAGAMLVQMDRSQLAEAAVTGSEKFREDAISELRQAGPLGLQALESRWEEDLTMLRQFGSLDPAQALEFETALGVATASELAPDELYDLSPEARANPAKHQAALERAMAGVTGQYDGAFSGLYWHTDRDRALALAKKQSKPVLSLRLLGRLDDEFC